MKRLLWFTFYSFWNIYIKDEMESEWPTFFKVGMNMNSIHYCLILNYFVFLFFLFPLKTFVSYESSSFFFWVTKKLNLFFLNKSVNFCTFNIRSLVEKYIQVQNSIEYLYTISSHDYMFSHWIFFIYTIVLKRCFHVSWTTLYFQFTDHLCIDLFRAHWYILQN